MNFQICSDLYKYEVGRRSTKMECDSMYYFLFSANLCNFDINCQLCKGCQLFSLLQLRSTITQEQINEYEADKREGQRAAVSFFYPTNY